MFKKIKQLFSRKEETSEEQELEQEEFVHIVYTIGKDNIVRVNVNLPEYSSEYIEDLALLINSVHSPNCLMTTVEMVKESLAEEEQDLLLEFLLKISSLMELHNKELGNNEPCVQPSDMI